AQLAAHDAGAEQAAGAALPERVLDALGGEGVLAADVDVAGLGADGEGGDGHGLDEGEGVLLEEDAVLEGAGLGLVGVAHEVARPRRRRAEGPPFAPGGDGAAAGAEEPGLADLAQDPGGPDVEGPPQRLVATMRPVVVEAGRIDAADPPQEAQPRIS